MFFRISIIIIFLVYTLVLCWYSIKRYNKIINSLTVMIIPLAFVFLNVKNLEVLSSNQIDNTLTWIFIGTVIYSVSFGIGASTVFRFGKQNNFETETVYYNKRTVEVLINIVCVMEVISFLIAFAVVYKIAGSVNAILVNSTRIRYRYLEHSSSGFTRLITLFLSFNIFTLSCLFPKAIQLRCKLIKIKLIFVVALMMMQSIVTMSKDAFIVDLFIIAYAFSQYSLNMRLEWQMIRRNLKWVIVFLVILLVSVGIQRNYLADRYDSYFDMVMGTTKHYIIIPFESFGLLLGTNNFSNGALCFRPIVNVLSYLGIGERMPIIQQTISGGANVYTAFGNMYWDFGYHGIIFLSVGFGFFFGCFYFIETNDRLSRVAVNSIVAMTMFFTFYDLKIIQTVYIFTIFYALIFEKLIEKRLYTTELVMEETTYAVRKHRIKFSRY